MINARDKLITCHQKAGLSLVQINTTIISSLLRKKIEILRIYIDYYSINTNSVVNEYLLPRIGNTPNYLGISLVYSKLVLTTSCH